MAEFTAPATSTIVLRKRKRSPASLVLRISSSPSPSYDTFSESEYEPHTAERDVLGPSNDVRVKPSRLAEHQRSHTGDVRASNVLRKSSVLTPRKPFASTFADAFARLC